MVLKLLKFLLLLSFLFLLPFSFIHSIFSLLSSKFLCKLELLLGFLLTTLIFLFSFIINLLLLFLFLQLLDQSTLFNNLFALNFSFIDTFIFLLFILHQFSVVCLLLLYFLIKHALQVTTSHQHIIQ